MYSNRHVRVLLLEDNPADVLLIQETFADLTDVEYTIEHVELLADAMRLASDSSIDVALIDLGVPDSQGIETFRTFRDHAPQLPVLVLTALNDLAMGILALQEGAQDYLIKHEVQPSMLGRVIRYSIERNELHIELARSRDRLRMLAARLQNMREQERMRISREFHDQLGQKMSALKMDLSWLELRLQKPLDAGIVSSMNERLLESRQLADSIIETVQRIATELRPSALDHLGLPDALREELRQFDKRSQIATQLILPDSMPALSDEVATTLFRIFQELLTNIARHAEATETSIELSRANGELCLTVRDNGIGMDPQVLHSSTSLGLLGIHERAMAHRGQMTIDSAPGRGTAVSVTIPIAAGH